MLSLFVFSLQGLWCNTSIDSDGERLHERVIYDTTKEMIHLLSEI